MCDMFNEVPLCPWCRYPSWYMVAEFTVLESSATGVARPGHSFSSVSPELDMLKAALAGYVEQ